jgi:hypothetical protein
VAGRGGEAAPPTPSSPSGSQGDPEDGPPALEPLESSVKQAAARLAQLRQLNLELSQKVRELEAHLAARTGGNAGADPAWEAEWAEIRRRVDALARHLERLAVS